MARVREVVTRSENFYHVTGLNYFKDYTPDPTGVYFAVGDGLVFYIPKGGMCMELFTAVKGSDLPDHPIQELHKQWKYLAGLGVFRIYAFANHHRSRLMCRAAGMNLFNEESSMYEQVIYGW